MKPPINADKIKVDSYHRYTLQTFGLKVDFPWRKMPSGSSIVMNFPLRPPRPLR
jgi:hypothetical protein